MANRGNHEIKRIMVQKQPRMQIHLRESGGIPCNDASTNNQQPITNNRLYIFSGAAIPRIAHPLARTVFVPRHSAMRAAVTALSSVITL